MTTPANVLECLVPRSADILRAIAVINNSDARIALVIDDGGRLIGTVTDGDVRRGILRGVALTDAVTLLMNRSPHVIRTPEDRPRALQLMRANVCRQVPVLDSDGRVSSIETLDDALHTVRQGNWVLLMAGGRGRRLSPLTDSTPKPMLRVGGKPILETIIDNLSNQGFKKVFISINYKGDMVADYFGDGSRKGLDISYLVEDEPLGTAGPLSLLPERPPGATIVMNGDILTTIDFNQLLEFHDDHKADGTICVTDYKIEVPFGVVEVEGHRISGIVEKPVRSFKVSAGIYALSPNAIAMVPAGERFDMPALFKDLLDKKKETAVFPIREYWMDIGRIDDFERANREYEGLFDGSPKGAGGGR
jgi:dTDP-glucose pyrophosphorylase